MLFNSTNYCLLSGIIFALSTPSIGIWQLSFIAFIPLFFATEKQFHLNKTSFHLLYFYGIAFSYIYTVSIFYWIAHLSWIAMLMSAAFYALIYGLFVPGIVVGLKAGLSKTMLSIWVVFLWISLEAFLSDIFFPIPSLAIGYTVWPFKQAIQIADITGVSGVSFWIIAVNVLIFRLIKDGIRKSYKFLSVAMLITIVLLGYGMVKTPDQNNSKIKPVPINIVYSSISSKDKEDKESINKIFEALKQKTIQSIKDSISKPELVVWPETSVPVFLRSVQEKEFIMGLVDLAQNNEVTVLVGALSFEQNKNRLIKYNSAFLIPHKGFINQEYRKNILIPFVEMDTLNGSATTNSKLSAGKESGSMKLFDGTKFGVIICYEAFFPDFVRKAGDKNSGFIVNITSDRYAFDDIKPAYKIPFSHLVYRAVENRKSLIRSANWGYSMVISPKGEIIKSSSIGTEGYFTTKITPNYGETFFSRHGFVFAKLIMFITAIWFFFIMLKIYRNNHNVISNKSNQTTDT